MTSPLWIPCPCCDEYLCTRHGIHASECDCPEIDEMDFDPYTESGMMKRKRGRPPSADPRQPCPIRLPRTVIRFLDDAMDKRLKSDPRSAYNVGRLVESLIVASTEFKNWRKNHVAE